MISRQSWVKMLSRIGADYRKDQHNGAEIINSTIEGDRNAQVCIEAPTGTGKTIMYLMGTLASGNPPPLLVSTSTKILQDQTVAIIRGQICKGLARDVSCTTLKGRNNYFCANLVAFNQNLKKVPRKRIEMLQRVQKALQNDLFFGELRDDIKVKAKLTKEELEWLKRNVTCDSVACRNGQCHEYLPPGKGDICNYQRLMQHAGSVEVIVTNHHALFTLASNALSVPDSVLNRVYVLDEAHMLDSAASQVLTVSLESALVTHLNNHLILLRDASFSGARENLRQKILESIESNCLQTLLDNFTAALKEFYDCWHVDDPLTVTEARRQSNEFKRVVNLYGNIRKAALYIEEVCRRAEKHKDELHLICHRILETVDQLRKSAGIILGDRQEIKAALDDLKRSIISHTSEERSESEKRRFRAYFHAARARVYTDKNASHNVSWLTYNYENANWKLARATLDNSEFLNAVWGVAKSSVFVSATLAAGETQSGIDWFKKRTGINASTEFIQLSQVFDFSRQCLIFVPENEEVCPADTQKRESYIKQRALIFGQVMAAIEGRTMNLFCSMERLWGLQQILTRGAREKFKILQQTTGDNLDDLAREFCDDEHSCLNATRSFFQGFDAPGPTLSCLIIEKLPFEATQEPILQGRLNLCRERKGDWFEDEYLPNMLIALRQAFGRLIRTPQDHGICILADPRLLDNNRSYAAVAKKSLQVPEKCFHKFIKTDDILKAIPAGFFPFSWNVIEAKKRAAEFASVFPEIWEELLGNLRFRRLVGKQNLEDVLKRLGIKELHQWQQPIIHGIIEGNPKNRQQLVVYPTGSGKSLLYQVPGLLLEGLTIVVTPLVALMQDQVDSLWHRGITEATYINSSISEDARKKCWRDVRDGNVKLLYLAPERFAYGFLDMLRRSLLRPISLMAIDEAHQISESGHAFRPLYRYLPEVRSALGNPFMLAVTATAGPAVRKDICEQFGIQQEQVYFDSVVRLGIKQSVIAISKTREHYSECREIIREAQGKPVIIYAVEKRYLHSLYGDLRGEFGDIITIYHGDLNGQEREENQRKFIQNKASVMLATTAFGQGIDKPDIWAVVYNNMPLSIEELVQGGGRVCRDRKLMDKYLAGVHLPRNIIIYKPGDFKEIKSRFINTLNKSGDECIKIIEECCSKSSYFPCRVEPTKDDQHKNYYIVLQFLLRNKMMKSFHYKWDDMSFRVEGLRPLEELRRKSQDLEEGFRQYWSTSVIEHKEQALKAVNAYCNARSCRYVHLQTYFGESVESGHCCHICDIDGSPNVAKHRKYVDEVSRTYRRETPEDQLFKEDILLIENTDQIFAYLNKIVQSKDAAVRIQALERRHRESGQEVSGYSFLARLLTYCIRHKSNFWDKLDIVSRLAQDAYGLGEEYKLISIEAVNKHKDDKWLPVFEWENPAHVKRTLDVIRTEKRPRIPEDSSLVLELAEAIPPLIPEVKELKEKIKRLKFEENIADRNTVFPTENEFIEYIDYMAKEGNACLIKELQSLSKSPDYPDNNFDFLILLIDICKKKKQEKMPLQFAEKIARLTKAVNNKHISNNKKIIMAVLEHYQLSDWKEIINWEDAEEVARSLIKYTEDILYFPDNLDDAIIAAYDVPPLHGFAENIEKTSAVLSNKPKNVKSLIKNILTANESTLLEISLGAYSLADLLCLPDVIKLKSENSGINIVKIDSTVLLNFTLKRAAKAGGNQSEIARLIIHCSRIISDKLIYIKSMRDNFENLAAYCEMAAEGIENSDLHDLLLTQSAVIQKLIKSKIIEVQGKTIAGDEIFLKRIKGNPEIYNKYDSYVLIDKSDFCSELDALIEIAEHEHEEADEQFKLGLRYLNGYNMPQDYAEAVNCFRKSAELDHAGGQVGLATCYRDGKGVAKDYAEAVKWFRKSAEQGNADGQAGMGLCFLDGKGVAQDNTEAVKWFRKSAEQGNVNGQFSLGFCCRDGKGVAQDNTEAVKWFRKSAEQGDADGQFELGICYRDGRGVAQDSTESDKWFRKAAEQGRIKLYEKDIMPVKSGNMYLVKCEKCDWSENVFIRESPVPLLSLFGGKRKLPKKCPECGGRVSARIDIAARQ